MQAAGSCKIKKRQVGEAMQKNIIVLRDFKLKYDREQVLQMADCHPGSPVYHEVLRIIEALQEPISQMLKPAAVLAFSEVEPKRAVNELPAGTQVLYCILTVGNAATELSRKYFEAGDYLKGMLADAIADSYLYSLDCEAQSAIKKECQKRGYGVSARFEAPDNIPIYFQKVAFEETMARKNLDIRMTEGLMFEPVKTICQVFSLTSDTAVFHTGHDCANCGNVGCSMRDVGKKTAIKVISGRKEKQIFCKEGESLLQALTANGFYVAAVCGGHGRCGKCKVRFLDQPSALTEADKAYFTYEELLMGWRLACLSYPTCSSSVELGFNDESYFSVVSTLQVDWEKDAVTKEKSFAFAIDIGTTTLAVSLVGLDTGIVYGTNTGVNHQRSFGADVVSRIQSAEHGKALLLQKSVRDDLVTGMKNLLQVNGVEKYHVRRTVIVGNTTMGHLLLGYPCEGLGRYPFKPVNIEYQSIPFKDALGKALVKGSVDILPGISAYVGADVVSGLFSCHFHSSTEINILIDLGTNAEMAIGTKDKILVASAAAGPAFEGGNISCGTGSIRGAICDVHIEDGVVGISTIGEAPPTGICGTGVIAVTAELLKNGIVDQTGLMDEQYFMTGYHLAETEYSKEVSFSQKDIREVQLAKAAIRAGLETLISHYGADYADISHVYLAGGFGFYLNSEQAAVVGLIPPELKGKLVAVGNSALGGAVDFLKKEGAIMSLEHIVSVSSEVSLASDEKFQENYLKYMMFDEGN